MKRAGKRRLPYYPVLVIALLTGALLTACGKSSGTVSDNAGNIQVSDDIESVDEELLYLCGEHKYTIVYDDSCGDIVEEACETLQAYLGANLEVSDDETAEASEYEILLGQTKRPESSQTGQGLGENDYRIMVINEKLVLVGGSDSAVVNAVAALIRDPNAIMEAEDGGPVIAREYNILFEGADSREEYIADPDLFLCSWILDFDVPEWMLDFEEKWDSFHDPDGRMMTMHHRGDWMHYPENSIEAIISSIKMGADSIEIDLRLTRDGVVVLLHDETLIRTTDWYKKAGKNGLPDSEYVSDWTYEELCQLRLKSTNDDLTDYIIPTFKEVLQVCNERTTLWLDKCGVWDWDRDVYPLIKETGAWRTCIIDTYGDQKKIVDTIKADSGIEALMLYTFKEDECTNWRTQLDSLKEEGYSPMMDWSGFNTKSPESSVKTAGSNLEQVRDDVRIRVDVHALFGGIETPKAWDFLCENGLNFVVIDNGLKVQKYIAEKMQ